MDEIRVAHDNEQLEYGNEPSGFLKGGAFLDDLSSCLLRKKYSGSWS
jgi:hypothetical protein